ncbi:MAG: hypothetical protein U0931_34110 [Vulcanimicrobiota bacterium]
MKRRGASLVNTLMVSTLLAGLAFTTASLTISQLAVNSRLENSKIARDLAESAASRMLSEVMSHPEWTGDTEVLLESAPGGWGRASFSSAHAHGWSIPPSTNNLTGLTARSSQAQASRSLPPNSVEVISVGSYRGATSTVSQVIAIPPYRYAMASTGSIQSSGGLTVASVDDPSVLSNGFDSVLDEQLRAGHLAGNLVGPKSVTLEAGPGRPVLVKGGVDSAGSVSLLGGAKVVGSVRQNGQPVPLPDVDVNDYDPKARADVVTTSASSQAHLVVDKPTRQTGNLKVTSGLELTKGYLFVDGNLDIYGGIKGKGAIFATGDVKIHGVSTYGANNQQAIVAKGNVGIDGTDRNHSIFQGVIYTEGDFNAKDVTLVGSLVGNKAKNPDGSGGTDMQLYACNVLYNQQIMDTSWNSGFEPGQTKNEDGNILLDAAVSFDTGSGSRGITLEKKPKAANFYDPKTDRFDYARGVDSPYTTVQIPTMTGGYHEFSSWDEALETLGTPNHGLPIRIVKNPAAGGLLGSLLGSLGALLGFPPPSTEPVYLQTWDPVGMAMIRDARVNGIYGMGADAVFEIVLFAQVTLFDMYYQSTKPRWMKLGDFGFNMNPNKFIQMSDKARRMMWWDE